MTTARTPDALDELWQNVIAPIVLLVSVMSVLLVTGFIALARDIDRDDRARAHRVASATLAARVDDAARALRDRAGWPAADVAMGARGDRQGAGAAAGGGIDRALEYDYVFLVRAGGGTSYAPRKDERAGVAAQEVVPIGLQPLLAAARASVGTDGPEPAVAFVGLDEGVALAAAVAIVPEPDSGLSPGAGAPSLMVLVDPLDAEALLAFADRADLKRVRVEALRPEGSSVPLLDATGRPVAFLAWDQALPGSERLSLMLPLVGLALAATAAATGVVLRRGHGRSVRATTEAAEKLRQSEARFRDFADASADWLWETDEHDRFVHFSDGHVAALGTDIRPFFLGRTRWELGLAAGNDPERWDWLRREIRARRPFRGFRYRIDIAGARRVHVRTDGKPVYARDGRFKGYRGTGSNITAEVEAAARAEHLAFYDPLTRLPTRGLLTERLGTLVTATVGTGRLAAVICLDLDHFKEVNDARGHAVGDLVLRVAARRLEAAVRSTDTVARLGGDGFAVLQANVSSLREVQALCERLLATFAEPFALGGEPPTHLGASIGVAIAPVDGTTPADLLRHGDLALFRAKEDGRNRFRLFEPIMDAQLEARGQLEADLRQAIASEALEVHYQPVVDVANGTVVGAEALVRWRHPEHGMLSPAIFIPVIEQSALIVELGDWVLRRACAEAASWPWPIWLSVNLAPAQLGERGFPARVGEVLREAGLEPGRLEFEITEASVLRDTDRVVAALEALKAQGIRIAMDDFGSGYSSLGYLQRFPFDRLKIDRPFVRDLFAKAESTTIIRAVIGLGRGLGIDVTAEGVETEAQLSFLSKEGCGTAQGFHLGRPMRPERFKAWLGGCAKPAAADRPELPDSRVAVPAATFEGHPGSEIDEEGRPSDGLAGALGVGAGSLWLAPPPPGRPAADA